MARKGKYHKWLTKDGQTVLRGFARSGLTDAEIAEKMDIHVSTLYDWKNKYPEIDESLKKGKDVFDDEVEESLFKSAGGYFVEEEKQYITEKDGVRTVHTEKIKKYIQPNVTAQIFWLKNRKPAEWRDKQEQSITGVIEGFNINITEDDINNEEE